MFVVLFILLACRSHSRVLSLWFAPASWPNIACRYVDVQRFIDGQGSLPAKPSKKTTKARSCVALGLLVNSWIAKKVFSQTGMRREQDS